MGIFGALTTAVTGLRAQSYALENISGNIANSQTTAFKRIDTSFVDLIPDASPSKQLAGNVTSNSRSTNTVQGDIQTTSIGTFMAINGDGFFVVEKPASFQDNRPIFDGIDLFTRRGDFQPDKNGYLVNGAGYYLMGIPVDATTGNLVGSTPQLLQFQNDFLPAQATTQRRRRAVKSGRNALDALDALKVGLIGDTLDSSALNRLKVAAGDLKEPTGDAGLDAVLGEINLRVEVEIAKLAPR